MFASLTLTGVSVICWCAKIDLNLNVDTGLLRRLEGSRNVSFLERANAFTHARTNFVTFSVVLVQTRRALEADAHGRRAADDALRARADQERCIG